MGVSETNQFKEQQKNLGIEWIDTLKRDKDLLFPNEIVMII